MRAMSSHEMSPIPRNSIPIERPNTTSSRISTNMYGTATITSTIRIITPSVRPPTNPAVAP